MKTEGRPVRRRPPPSASKGAPRVEVEAPEQMRVVMDLDHAGLLFNAQHNGLHLSKKKAADAVKLGTRKGAPDLMIFTPPPLVEGAVGVALEMKTEAAAPLTSRAGKWSGAEVHQKQWLAALEALGWVCLVGYGAEDALEKLANVCGYNVGPRRGVR